MRAALVLLPLALVAAAAPSRDRPLDPKTQAELDKELAGLVPGAPISCIPLSFPTISTRTYGNVLLYKRSRTEVYRNDTAGGCESAGNGDFIVQVEHEGRPCSGDILRTVDTTTHMTTGSCALGQFIPYTRPSTPR